MRPRRVTVVHQLLFRLGNRGCSTQCGDCTRRYAGATIFGRFRRAQETGIRPCFGGRRARAWLCVRRVFDVADFGQSGVARCCSMRRSSTAVRGRSGRRQAAGVGGARPRVRSPSRVPAGSRSATAGCTGRARWPTPLTRTFCAMQVRVVDAGRLHRDPSAGPGRSRSSRTAYGSRAPAAQLLDQRRSRGASGARSGARSPAATARVPECGVPSVTSVRTRRSPPSRCT